MRPKEERHVIRIGPRFSGRINDGRHLSKIPFAAYHWSAADRSCFSIILLKAGLTLDFADLKKVGRPAIMMACVPASFEMLAFFLFAPYLLNITRSEAAVMGAVLAAVSPAVVVPRSTYGSAGGDEIWNIKADSSADYGRGTL